jgi:hypothetical protein
MYFKNIATKIQISVHPSSIRDQNIDLPFIRNSTTSPVLILV